MKYLHFIGGRLYSIDGRECDEIPRERGQTWYAAVLMMTRGSAGLSTFGNYADSWLRGLEGALTPFGLKLAKSARVKIGTELMEREKQENASASGPKWK